MTWQLEADRLHCTQYRACFCAGIASKASCAGCHNICEVANWHAQSDLLPSESTSCVHCAAQLVAKLYNINPHPHWEIFLCLLCFLFSLHVYWCAPPWPPHLPINILCECRALV